MTPLLTENGQMYLGPCQYVKLFPQMPPWISNVHSLQDEISNLEKVMPKL